MIACNGIVFTNYADMKAAIKKNAYNCDVPYEILTSTMLHEFMHTLAVCHTVMID